VSEARAQQLGRARAQVARARLPAPQAPAPDLPVARVAVDVGLAHLDRPFDYSVTADQHEQVVPGCRVMVRFAGQQVAGFVVERVDASEHPGTLQRLRRVLSPEPVLTAPVARLCRAVADHYAGTLSDVLRLAVPPRHARVEKEARPVEDAGPLPDPRLGDWAGVDGGPALLDRLAAGESPRAAWTALPGDDTAAALAAAAAACLRSGRGSVLCVPDARDVARIDAALTAALGTGRHVALTADLGPAARYRAFLAALRAGCRWWSAPGQRPSRPCVTSAWSSAGTTATTRTPSRGHRTRTCVRSWPTAPT
jgi:primosomal protein N' (replication factor Y)